jgi:carbonic anhydrase
MDSRIALFGALGLRIGDAHLIRNAGGLPTDDALRSLAISQHRLGTRAIMLIGHTDCGMLGFDDPAFRAELAGFGPGPAPSWDVPGFTDVRDSVRRSLEVVRATPWLHTELVRGFVFDVGTAQLTEVE